MNSPLRPVFPPPGRSVIHWGRLHGSARGLAITQTATARQTPVLVITHNAQTASVLADEIRFYGSGADLPLLSFPDWECLPYDVFSPHPDIVSDRLATLHALPALRRGIVIAGVGTLLHRLPPPAYVAGQSFQLDTGTALDLDQLRAQMIRAAYRNVSQVIEPGEFAVRGGIVDLFPVGSPVPFRLDLFDNQLESIREFDPQTQRSGKILDRIRLLPAREFPLTEDGIQLFRANFRTRFEGDPQKVSLYRDVSQGMAPPGIEYYLPLFFDSLASIFEYLPEPSLLVLDEGIDEAARTFLREAGERFTLFRNDRERPRLPPEDLFLSASLFREGCEHYARIELHGLDTDTIPDRSRDIVLYDSPPPALLPVDAHSDSPYRSLLHHMSGRQGRTLLVAESAGHRETWRALLIDNNFPVVEARDWSDFLTGDALFALTAAALDKGLVLREPDLQIITESQLYGERAAQRRRRSQLAREPETIFRSLAELKPGDAVVHEEHGIGRYLGLQILDVGESTGAASQSRGPRTRVPDVPPGTSPIGDGPTEFLALEYAGGDKLYVPVTSLHLVSRYTGSDPEQAPLHKLGGEAWEKARRRAMEKAHDAAAELLEIQALRAARPGHAFAARNLRYSSFADSFPFEETPDQEKAIEDVLSDMESAKPMDRLVCGDVGFGKTEVAMRAAFLAVQDGSQVAVLTPTTLLASQHYLNFRDRFADFRHGDRAIVIEVLSRFQSKSEESAVLEALAQGRADIVIGTHRLLQSDIRFKQLGLIIIDEEHRFGVRQKERLKQLRAEVDVLTLTATPIPRTLNLSLAGMRDISIIAQAPEGRLSIKTFVSEHDRGLIREACLREIRRGGQVYYLHNEVSTIDRTAQELKALLPVADIHVAHGQMPERELERIMLDFYHQRFNILVCSTIIESGIDVPSANTIIIDRADKLGLGQLHQLRGRVGRSRHRAYAYLMIPGWKAISADARKRLDAIGSLEDLGAGFALASHDLEIRGAGELLGEQQSGVIDEVGFTLYAELLERAVRSLRAGRKPDFERPATSTEINLHAPALLPDDYLPDIHLRLVLYKRIAAAPTRARLQELEEEIVDRFGRLPPAGSLLFQTTALKLKAQPLGIRRIDAGPKGARVEFTEKPDIDPAAIIRLMQSAPQLYRLDGPNRIRLQTEMPTVDARLKSLNSFVEALSGDAPAAVAKRT